MKWGSVRNVRRGRMHWPTLVLTVAMLFPIAPVAAQSDRRLDGPIERLTAETRELALECGRAGAECAVHRYELCQQENIHYSVRLITPFSRVAEAAFDAQQGRKPLGRIGPATVNRWGIALSVLPAANSAAAAAIDSIEIQREGRVLQPTKITVGPITTDIGEGAVRQLTRGFFVFSANAFESSSDITIMLAGSSGRESCLVSRDRLRSLQ